MIFVSTLVAVLATDLLIGIGIGIAVKLSIHLLNGLPLRSVFKPYLEVTEQGEHRVVVSARGSAVFSNFIPFRRQIEQLGLEGNNDVVVDFSQAELVDHSVMEKMHELEDEFLRAGKKLEVRGLEGHRQFSGHPLAARKRSFTPLKRVTIVTDPGVEERLIQRIATAGASGYTRMHCSGAGRSRLEAGKGPVEQVWLEVIAPAGVANEIVDYVSGELSTEVPVSVCLETVEVNFAGKY